MREGWRNVRIGEVAQRVIEPVPLDPHTSYANLGVKWYGAGTFQREPKLGSEIRAKTLYRVRPGQFVYNRLFATEGSFALIRPEDANAVASNEFPVFDLDPTRILGDYLYLYFQQPSVWSVVAAQCVGTTKSRLRWKEDMFLSHTLTLPPVEEQRRIVDLIGALDDTIAAAERVVAQLVGFTELARDTGVWSTQERVPLGDICSVDGSLVPPTGEFANLPHVGTDRIVGGTGDLHGVVSAAEDGVKSGKYLFDTSHVIYSKIRPNLRKVALPSGPGLCSADAYPLLPAEGVPRRYLQQLLLSHRFTDLAVARSGRTKMPKINRAELLSIAVPAETTARMAGLSDQFDALDEARHKADAERRVLSRLRSNLLTTLLSGEHEIPEAYDELIEEVA